MYSESSLGKRSLKNLSPEEILEWYRDANIELARREFWEFCKLRDPEFYCEERVYLRELCETLQALYEGKLLKSDGSTYKNLKIHLPPRHGKSRTLTNFSAWVFGKNIQNRIITASFNDELATDFSRYTRDIIMEERSEPDEIIYSDIFPETRIKRGDSAMQRWALEGSFFSYKGTGINGSITGKGGNIIMVDDPVKDAFIAYNDHALEKIWTWYSGTLIQRAEKAIKILCMTPWSKKDLGGILSEKQPDEWFELTFPACTNGEMLCPDILDFNEYQELKDIGDKNIISANYDMVRLDVQGALYREFETYETKPRTFDRTVFYSDTADTGTDYLCGVCGVQKDNFIYVTDVLFTQDPQEDTEPATADLLELNQIYEGWIESNNGGRGFARNVKRILDERGVPENIQWFHQSENKVARILTNAPLVQKYILFPEDWWNRWPEFYAHLRMYKRVGKNAHDDGPDTLTGLVEKYIKTTPGLSQEHIAAMAAIRRQS